MKKNMLPKIVVKAALSISLIGAVLSIKNVRDVEASDPYKLVWSDEFNGGEINRDNWINDLGHNNGWGNQEWQEYTDKEENIRVENGNLVINALAQKDGDKMKYTSGRIRTTDLVSVKYGRVEARIKVPKVTGLWPAFWMLGDSIKKEGWPYCGEIDILETWNTLNFAQGTVHFENEVKRPFKDTYLHGSIKMADKSQWHTYAMTWDKDYMVWSMDGVEYHRVKINRDYMQELHQSYYIILNMAMGGTLPGHKLDPNFTSDNMYVDYVRVFQRKSDNGSLKAVWNEADKNAIPKYKVTINNSKTIEVLDGETISLEKMKKRKYLFKGWFDKDKKVTENTEIRKNYAIAPVFTKVKVKKPAILKIKQKYKKMALIKVKIKGKYKGFQVKVGSKKKLIKSKSKTMFIGKYKSGKKLKVKVRAYNLDSVGKKVYGKWSKKKKIIVK